MLSDHTGEGFPAGSPGCSGPYPCPLCRGVEQSALPVTGNETRAYEAYAGSHSSRLHHTGFDRSSFPVTHAECSKCAWLYNYMITIVSCTRLLDLNFSGTHEMRQAQMAESS